MLNYKNLEEVIDTLYSRTSEAVTEAGMTLALTGLINLLDSVADRSEKAQRLQDDLRDALERYNGLEEGDEEPSVH